MKIVYLWDADYPWDVRTEKVCRALTQAGHDVHIVARNRLRRSIHQVLPEGQVHRMRPWRFLSRSLDSLLSFPVFFNPRWIATIQRVVRRVGADLIIVRDLPLCPTAIHVARRNNLPVLMDMAENYPAMMQDIWLAGRQRTWDILVRNPRIVAAVERWCLARLDAIIVVVEESGERLQRLGVDGEKLTVVSNTPPRDRVSPRGESASAGGRSPVEIVYLGLLELPRGIGELLDAAAMCKADGYNIRVTIVGDGRDGEILRRRASELGVADTVRFVGWLNHRDALEIVRRADIGVVPHHADEAWNTTISNKLFDYMAAGLAVISSDALPSQRVLQEAEAGVVFRSGDATSLREAIVQLVDPKSRAAMALAGQNAIRTKFNWENDTQALLELVNKFREGRTKIRSVDSAVDVTPAVTS